MLLTTARGISRGALLASLWISGCTCSPAPTEIRAPAPSASTSSAPAPSGTAARRRPHCSQATTPHRREDEIFFAPLDSVDPWVALDNELDGWKGGTHLAVAVGFGVPFGDPGLARLLRHPKVAQVTHLSVQRSKITPGGLRELLASPIAPRLVELDLRDALLGVEGATLLASTDRLGSLEELNLGRCYLHADGARELARATGLRALERLELGYDLVGVDGAAALVASTAFPRLRHLGLAYGGIGDAGARLLPERRAPERLECLDLQYNEIALDGAEALSRWRGLPGDTFVFLGGNLWNKDKEAALEGSPHLAFEAPDLPGQVAGLPGGDPPKSAFSVPAAAPPPPTLPAAAAVEFRELWVWEFGLVAEYPTFLTPDELPGNGKSRGFAWLDRAGFVAGGHWNTAMLPPEQAFAHELADAARAKPGDRVRIEPLEKHAALVWRRGSVQSSVTRVQGADGLIDVYFWYPTEHEAYFRPIAEHCVRSVYFDYGTSAPR
jgi:Leucine Rich repeat